MNRLLACAALALGLAACGGRDAQDPSAKATAPAAEQQAAAAVQPAPAEPAGAETAAATGPAADGESVDDATASISPIAAAVAANTPAPSATLPSKWQSGQHFAPLPAAQPVSVAPGEIEVTEIFWYGCGHCFTLEPQLEAWEQKGKPDYVKLVRMPVVWNEVAREDARLFYTLEALGKTDELNLAVFRELHVNRNPLTVVSGNRVDTAATERKVREFLLSKGVSAEDFARTYRSFAIENKLRQAENLSRRYLADHTPMVVVQGKYMTDVSMAGGIDQFFELIGDLAARERAAR
jgi:thiol:disulfide interchange protein DsbA